MRTSAGTCIATIASRTSFTASRWHNTSGPSATTLQCCAGTRWWSASGAWRSAWPRGPPAAICHMRRSIGCWAPRSGRRSERRRTATSSGTGRSGSATTGTSSRRTGRACCRAPRHACRSGPARRRAAKTRWKSSCTLRRRSHASSSAKASSCVCSMGGTSTCAARASVRSGPTRVFGRRSRSAKPLPGLRGSASKSARSARCAMATWCGCVRTTAAS
mmetsp:Transcript_29559/g.75261  ORF Transcript_29559/g.75261 Transcript_29559/m.75261 type:complete len:218 (-) Transcript_29559:413-1066(-)